MASQNEIDDRECVAKLHNKKLKSAFYYLKFRATFHNIQILHSFRIFLHAARNDVDVWVESGNLSYLNSFHALFVLNSELFMPYSDTFYNFRV